MGRLRRSAMNSAVRRTESATRPTRSAAPRPPLVPSRAMSAAMVTASREGAAAVVPSRRTAPNRCQPAWDQWRTGTSRAVPEAGRGMRKGVPAGPSGRPRPDSRTQQRSRFSTAAASAATAGSGWLRRSGSVVGSSRRGLVHPVRGRGGVPSFCRGTVAVASAAVAAPDPVMAGAAASGGVGPVCRIRPPGPAAGARPWFRPGGAARRPGAGSARPRRVPGGPARLRPEPGPAARVRRAGASAPAAPWFPATAPWCRTATTAAPGRRLRGPVAPGPVPAAGRAGRETAAGSP